MPWPLASDFSRMLQNPQVAFRDPELKQCRIEMDRLGQPRPRSGNFATVYKAVRADGSVVAIKVFNRHTEERGDRYRRIGAYLAEHPLHSLVEFAHYEDRGIRLLMAGFIRC